MPQPRRMVAWSGSPEDWDDAQMLIPMAWTLRKGEGEDRGLTKRVVKPPSFPPSPLPPPRSLSPPSPPPPSLPPHTMANRSARAKITVITQPRSMRRPRVSSGEKARTRPTCGQRRGSRGGGRLSRRARDSTKTAGSRNAGVHAGRRLAAQSAARAARLRRGRERHHTHVPIHGRLNDVGGHDDQHLHGHIRRKHAALAALLDGIDQRGVASRLQQAGEREQVGEPVGLRGGKGGRGSPVGSVAWETACWCCQARCVECWRFKSARRVVGMATLPACWPPQRPPCGAPSSNQ